MKYLKTFESLNNDWITDFYFLDNLNIVYDIITQSGYSDREVLRVEKKDKSAFLEIFSKNGKYEINVCSGSIKNPSTEPGARWYNLYNKSHDINDVLKIMLGYGIISKEEYNTLITTKKYNL